MNSLIISVRSFRISSPARMTSFMPAEHPLGLLLGQRPGVLVRILFACHGSVIHPSTSKP